MSVLVPVIDYLDTTNKRIVLLQGVTQYHPVEDIYKEVRHLRKVNESLRSFDMPVNAFGNIPKGGGKFTPRYAVFNDGWRILPFDEKSQIYVSGEQITDDGQSGPACVDTANLVNPVIVHYEPPVSEIVKDEAALAAIAFMSFNNEVWHDHYLGKTIAEYLELGIEYSLLGNSQYPLSEHDETYAIALEKQLRHIRYTGLHTGVDSLLSDIDLSGFHLHGDNPMNDVVHLGPLPDVSKVEFTNLTIFGVLDSDTLIRDCLVDGLTYFNGMVHQSALTSNPVIIGGASPSFFMSCYGYPSNRTPSVIDSNHSLSDIIIREWEGGLLLKNITEDVFVTITFRGKIIIDASCTAGIYNFSGTGEVINNSALTLDLGRVLDPGEIANQIWEHSSGVQVIADAKKSRQLQSNRAVISPDDSSVTIYDDDGVTILHQFDVSADKRIRIPA